MKIKEMGIDLYIRPPASFSYKDHLIPDIPVSHKSFHIIREISLAADVVSLCIFCPFQFNAFKVKERDGSIIHLYNTAGAAIR